MKTELVVMQPAITPGKKIEVLEHNVRNFRIHLALQHMSMLLLSMVENDSGNMTGNVIPSNVRDTWAQFNLILSELEFAKTHNDPPLADHESAYKILILKGSEIQKISNVKQKRVAMELVLAAEIMMSVDSANAQGNISEKDFSILERQLSTVRDAMTIWLGTGKDNADTGNEVPAFKHLGEIIPSVDMDYAEIVEPSKDLPLPHLPDVPDVEK